MDFSLLPGRKLDSDAAPFPIILSRRRERTPSRRDVFLLIFPISRPSRRKPIRLILRNESPEARQAPEKRGASKLELLTVMTDR